MFLIFVTMLIGGILGFVFREKVEQTMRYEMTSTIKLYGTRRQVTHAWDLTQSRLRCCGVQGFQDWGRKTPPTCCQEIDGIQRKPCQDYPTLSNTHNNGCYEIGLRFVQERAALMGTSGIIVAVFILIGMIFACLYFNMIE
jgi:tetraspanin-11